MRKLKVKTPNTVRDSNGLTKVFSNQADKMETLKKQILSLIEEAKKIDKRKKIATLSQFIDGYAKETYPTNPRNLSLDNIKSKTETAYQREIFKAVKSKLNTKDEVVWIDMELPVVFSKSRRRKSVDLIGLLNNYRPVLCELKFASKGHSDSPIYAVIELLIYYYLIQDNSNELDEENVFHEDKRVKDFKWKQFNENSVFIVGANDRYWTYWKNRYEKQKNEIELWQNSLPLEVQFFSSGNFDLENQKGTQSEWTEVILSKS